MFINGGEIMSTIVAISTSPGIGGIGIIRMSGEKSFEVINKIFKPKNNNKIEGYKIKYGEIINPSTNEVIDEVLVSFFIGPKSYTTENMCEINSHGGIIVMKQILDLCLKNGAVLAEPGEFTKRAFLNGRIDLVKAEAIIDIINAKTEKEKKATVAQLQGFLSNNLNKIRELLLDIMADIEANIDYPEYDVEEVTSNKLIEILEKTKNDLNKLYNSFESGKILKEGIKTSIIGKPNVGKSSLLNLILKEERAIVTEYEGTTRDTIEEFISIEGIPLKIIDTAGIRNTDNEVEKIGINKSREIAENSDLIIAMFDISREITDEDEDILNIIKDKNAIIVLNKIDLINSVNKRENFEKYNKPIIEMSTLENRGIDELSTTIKELYSRDLLNVDSENIVTNLRHQNLINKALEATNRALEETNAGQPLDIIAIYIKEILENLGKITGENVSDDIINEIFSKFCLGK